MSVVTFLKGFKFVCYACGIHERAEILLFKQILNGPAETDVSSLVSLPKSINNGYEAALQTYSEVV